MVVDISRSCKDSPCERVIKMQGDEASLLPPLLAKTLKASLNLGEAPTILYLVVYFENIAMDGCYKNMIERIFFVERAPLLI